jgi:putative transposase
VSPRLTRLDRLYVRGPIYFVTACTSQRRHLLAQPTIHATFLEFAKHGPKAGVWIGDYVLMPDHLHVFVALDDQRIKLSDWMRSLKGVLSTKLREEEIPSPYWQKGFFDHVLRSQESTTQKWEYIRDNPTRAGLVTRWNEWSYSGEVFPLEYRTELI